MRSWSAKRRAAPVVAALAVVLAAPACSDGDDGAIEPPAPQAPAADHLLAAGAPLAAGLRVPPGARLAGTVFEVPADGGTAGLPGDQIALLVVDEDPFAVFDDLAGQARTRGPTVPGTADACAWSLEGPPGEPPGPVAPAEVSGEPPDAPIAGLLCLAMATDGEIRIELELRWGQGAPGTIRVEVGPDGIEPSGDGEDATTRPPRSVPESGPPLPGGDAPPPSPTASDPVDPGADRLLPDPAAPEEPAPGDAFGGRGNCLAAEDGRFRLPAGAALVATEGGVDGASVLATDDAEATMDALVAAGREGELAGGFVAGELETSPLGGGGSALTRTVSTEGGGACTLLADEGGRFVLVTMNSG